MHKKDWLLVAMCLVLFIGLIAYCLHRDGTYTQKVCVSSVDGNLVTVKMQDGDLYGCYVTDPENYRRGVWVTIEFEWGKVKDITPIVKED